MWYVLFRVSKRRMVGSITWVSTCLELNHGTRGVVCVTAAESVSVPDVAAGVGIDS